METAWTCNKASANAGKTKALNTPQTAVQLKKNERKKAQK